MTHPPIDVRAISPGQLRDFLAFFDHEAFADNPKWASCYCQCMYVDHSKVNWR